MKKSTSSLEKALCDSEIRYRRLFESAKDGILILDAETGMIVDVNPFLINLLGYSKESFIEKTIWEIGFLKDVIGNKDKFLELQRDKYVRYEDLPLETADGRKINVEFVSNVYLVNNQKVIQCNIRDITKRKETEAGLEKTQKELAEIKTIADEASIFTGNIIDTVREPLLVLDEKLIVIRASRSFYNFFKVSPEYTIGKLIYELGNLQWDIQKLRELLEKILPEKTSFDNYEVEHDFSSIGKRIMLLNARQIKRALGKEKIILLAFEDVTERKRKERSLSEKSRLNVEYLNILLNHAHAPIITWDASLHIKRFNHEFEKLSGYKKSEVEDKKIEMLFPKNEIESTLKSIKNNIGDENPEVIEINILTKNKEIRTVLWNSANISDEEGKNTVATIAQDITGRKRSEEELSRSHEDLYSLLNSMFEGAYGIDIKGNCTFVNQSFLQMLGYQTNDEVVGKHIHELIHHSHYDGSPYPSSECKVYDAHQIFNCSDEVFWHKDGMAIQVEYWAHPIEKNGVVIGSLVTFIDITERKKLEKNLSTATEIAKLGNWEFDVKSGNFLFNEQYYRLIHGSSTEKQGGNSMSAEEFAERLVHPDDSKMIATSLQEAISSTDPEYLGQAEARVFRDNGDITNVMVQFKVLKDDTGRTTKVVGVNQDITVRKQLEKEKDILTSNLNERVKELTCLYSVSSIIEIYNISLDKMFKEIVRVIPSGWQYPDITCARIVIGKNEYKTTNYKETKWKLSSDIRIDGTISGFIEVFYLKEISGIDEGSFLKEEINLLNLIAARLGQVIDRKQAEGEITMLAHSLKSINECVSITDVEDKIIFVNDSFLKTYGYLENELIGENVNILRAQNNPAKFVEKILPATLKEGWKGELWNKRKDGSEFQIHLSTTIINDTNGKPLGLIGVASDITEQKRIESELIKAKEKAEESDRLKSAFLTNMSHEIRTPMNGILGFTGLLKEPKLTGREKKAYIDIIEKSGDRMLNTINDIINISKIESEKIEISVSDVNIKELARDIFNFFKPEAEEKELNFSYKNMLSASETIIKTDNVKLHTVLSNLIKNALKYTPSGSVEFGFEKKNKLLEFFVKDTGIGIPPEQKEFIFEPFRQGNETTTRNYEGAGLGLSISKAYVEMLGGKIWIESNKKQGSTFRFTIPYLNGIEEKEQLIAITEDDILRPGNLKILIVEDDESSRELLNILLKPMANNIFQASTGQEAIDACRNNPDIDLVLMDIQMPGMNGYEATRQIRKFNKAVVIIAQTAYAMLGDREKALEAGCNDYISKPIKMKALKEMIKRHFFQSESLEI